MSGGGKGGSQTTRVEIPKWLEDAARNNIARGDVISTIGYTPYYGPDVAATTPSQIAAMQGTNQAASAFGLGTVDPMAGMPQAQNFNGMAAYSSAPIYDQSLAELQRRAPGQYNALRAPFIDPVTGALPNRPFGPLVQSGGGLGGKGGGIGSLFLGGRDPYNFQPGEGDGNAPGPVGVGGGLGGYTGIRDMFDGGGPGASGSTFSGGGKVSNALNSLGISPAGSNRSSGARGGK